MNRVIKLTTCGIQIEGDPKHVEILVKEWQMENSNSVDTPMTSELTQLTSNRPLMNEVEAKSYRRAVARVNYMAQDRCDLSAASKSMSQSMPCPKAGDEMLVKIVIIYLKR